MLLPSLGVRRCLMALQRPSTNPQDCTDSDSALVKQDETVVLAFLLESMRLDDAARWLDCPNPEFDNQTPAALIRAGRKEVVLNLVERRPSH